MTAFLFLLFVGAALAQIEPYQEEPCTGDGGICVWDYCCPNNNYVSGSCPSQSGSVRCCMSDPTCSYNEPPCQDNGGLCIEQDSCPDDDYTSGECPTQSADVKCCYAASGGCGTKAIDLACQIQSHSSIDLLTVNPSGVDDGADSASNIRDTCNDKQAKRSSYCCSSGCAPGGSVCLSDSVLAYILDVGDSAASPSNTVQVNAIAGACHSSNSYHYAGTAVDFQVKGSSPWETYMDMCSAAGAVENLGPGDSGHDTHTHCAFSS